MSYRQSIFGVAFLFGLGVHSRCNVHAADISTDELIRNIAATEQRLLDIRIDGAAVDETLGSDGKWSETPLKTEATGWLNGMPGGPEKVEVRRRVSFWVGDDAPAPYMEESCVLGWNGQSGVYIQMKAGPIGHSGGSILSMVYSKPPPALRSFDAALGMQFSIFFYKPLQSRSFSKGVIEDVWPARGKPGIIYDVKADRLNGLDCLKLSLGKSGVVQHDIWFDPARSYAILRDEYHSFDASGKLVKSNRSEVTKLIEAAPGIWYPAEGFYYFWPGDVAAAFPQTDPVNKLPRRRHYSAASVVANDPKFDSAIFNVEIPDGRAVMDTDTGKSYVSGPTTRELDKDLKQAADAAKKAAAEAK